VNREQLMNVLIAPHVTDVKVRGVQVVNEPGKKRRFGKTFGRTQDWKKAYVRLIEGQAIDYEARSKG
jgi:large subunit ribosomal protein L23